ncbi:Cof-type HAD-IIB family hydrolase [Periweissella beninensis]|uniref:Cof-type HAD-IIB family hydrolase n=1 Tax=Periweissella beninensis TaxID=504936 RepID=UPI0021A64DB8|nr:Cof-type HAD-IIB family hydrolase [Periweissella beninensis]MCT4395580.1 HAD family hydrolase [Periweissella beninensis]
MTVKMIATDMDGTFLRDDKKYDVDRFREQLKFMDEKKIQFVAASGNQFYQLKDFFTPITNQYKIDFVADNGARIFMANKLIYEATVTREQLQKVIEWNAKNPASHNNLIILTGNHGAYVSNHAVDQVLTEVKSFYNPVYQVEKLLEIQDEIFKVTFVWPNKQVQAYVTTLLAIFGDELHATGSGFGSVDVLARGVNKASGLSKLQAAYNITADEIVAFGDNNNDLEMLNYVGTGYVMPNAYPAMHEVGFKEALADNNHDGVLVTIDQILENI